MLQLQTVNMENEHEEQETTSDITAEEDSPDEQMLQRMCQDYSQYLKIDVTKEKHQFEENIEELLTRLDEYCGLVDLIRSDTNLCLERTLPAIQGKSSELQVIFDRIDQLEAFVGMVRTQVNATEQLVEQAESQMGSFSSIKKMFSSISVPSFLSSKKQSPKAATPPPAKLKFTEHEIFKTEECLSYPEEGPDSIDSEPTDKDKTVRTSPASQSSENETAS